VQEEYGCYDGQREHKESEWLFVTDRQPKIMEWEGLLVHSMTIHAKLIYSFCAGVDPISEFILCALPSCVQLVVLHRAPYT
jgi:hypothetical protein